MVLGPLPFELLTLSLESMDNCSEMPNPVRKYLESEYSALYFYLWRPFLQDVLNKMTTPQPGDIDAIPSSVRTRAQNAIDSSIKLVARIRTWSLINWFSLRQSLMPTILVVAASRTVQDWVLEKELTDTLDGATEIFARMSKTSEGAKRALRLMSNIRASA